MGQILFLDASEAIQATTENWMAVLAVALGCLSVYALLPRPKHFPPRLGAATGAAALLLAGAFLIRVEVVNPETILFYAFSIIAVVSGGLLVTQQSPVRGALAFALVVLSTCGLFLLQAAPFLMAATIIVYAGAIIVTFLFVIMLAQQAGLSNADARSREPFLSCLAGFVLLGALLYVLHMSGVEKTGASSRFDAARFEGVLGLMKEAATKESVPEIAEMLGDESGFRDVLKEVNRLAEAARGSPEGRQLVTEVSYARAHWATWKSAGEVPAMRAALAKMVEIGNRVQAAHDSKGRARMPAENVAYLGRTLFTDYFLAVELGGTLLLVATIGTIAIAGRRAEGLR